MGGGAGVDAVASCLIRLGVVGTKDKAGCGLLEGGDGEMIFFFFFLANDNNVGLLKVAAAMLLLRVCWRYHSW